MRAVNLAGVAGGHAMLFFSLLALIIWQLWRGVISTSSAGTRVRLSATRDPGLFWLLIVAELAGLVLIAIKG